MTQNYQSITGKEYSKFIESPSRPGESAIEVLDDSSKNLLEEILAAITGQVSFVIENISAPLANTEYSFQLPTECIGYILRPRKICKAKLAFAIGETSTKYFSIGRGGYHREFFRPGLINIYFSSDLANNVFELLIYKKI